MRLNNNIKKINFSKVTPYQNIRITNAKLKFEKSLITKGRSPRETGAIYRENATLNILMEEKKFNQALRKQLAAANAKLKIYKTSNKEGINNKGWITRMENKIAYINKLSTNSYSKLNRLIPVKIVDVEGNARLEINVTQPIEDADTIEKEAVYDDIQNYIKMYGSLEEIRETSERLWRYISGMLVEWFGGINGYNKYAKQRKNDKIM